MPRKKLPRQGGGSTPSGSSPPGSGWSHPDHPEVTLSPEANAAADRFLQRARNAESRITPVMDRIARDTGGELIGRKNRLKTEKSLKEKIARMMRRNPDLTADQAIARINDSVRFTIGQGPGGYTDGVRHAQQTLRDAGFEPDPGQYKYRWNEGPGYKGINTTWVDPQTGTQFEVQYHTTGEGGSFWAKEDGTHHLYDEMKVLDESSPRYQELNAEQDRIFSSVPFPDGVGDLSSFDGSFRGR
jgi:hypothetical protein